MSVDLPAVPDTAMVVAITLTDNETGSYDPSLEFVGETWTGDAAKQFDSGGCNDCGCSLGDVWPGSDDATFHVTPIYQGGQFGPVIVGTATGGASESFSFGDTAGIAGGSPIFLPYVPMTLTVWVGTTVVFVPFADQDGPGHTITLHSKTGDVYASARVACLINSSGV